jgi:hypothetical protein
VPRPDVSAALKGGKLSDSHKKAISASLKGKRCSEETREKISKSHIGLKHTEETRKKLRDSHLGKEISEATKIKLSDKLTGRIGYFKGHSHSEESKKIMSEKSKKSWVKRRIERMEMNK